MSEKNPLEPRPGIAQPPSREAHTATSAQSDPADPVDAMKTLQYQFNTLLILLFIISGTLAVYFYMQCRYSGREARNLREHALPQIQQYTTNTGPQVQRFLDDLARYASQRPDVIPILTRYGVVSRSEAPAPAAPPPLGAPPPTAKP